MKLSELPTLTLTEASGRAYTFDYPNYNDDPRPTVLVLGLWNNPKTNQPLLGGINLNYVSERDADRLKKAIPIIMRGRDLKSRYWAGRRLLPDIFSNYYRTYNASYIRRVSPIDFTTERDRDLTKAGLDANKIKKAVAALQADTPELTEPDTKQGGPKPVSVNHGLDKGGDETQTTNPLDDEPQVPWKGLLKAIQKREKEKEKKAEQQKDATAKIQKTKLLAQKAVEKPTAAQRPDIAAVPDHDNDEEISAQPSTQNRAAQIPATQGPATQGPATQGPATQGLQPPIAAAQQPEIKPKYKFTRKTPVEAVVNRQAIADDRARILDYRRTHRPAAFLARPAINKPLLAVYDLITGITLVDRVEDHAAIIVEAGWDYNHVVRIVPVVIDGRKRLLPLADDLPQQMLDEAINRLPPLVVDHLLADMSNDI